MISNEHALTYMKERYADELQMLKEIEDKSIKLTSLISLLIAALGTFLKFNNKAFVSPSSHIDWFHIGLAVFLFVFLFISLSKALWTMKISRYPTAPCNREALEYIKDADKEDCEEYIARCYIDVIEILRTETKAKVASLSYCYISLVIGLSLSFILFTSFYTSVLLRA